MNTSWVYRNTGRRDSTTRDSYVGTYVTIAILSNVLFDTCVY